MLKAPTNPPPVPRESRASPLKYFLFAFLAAFALSVVTFLFWRNHVDRQVNARLNALSRAGYPVSSRELQAKYYAPVSAAQNSAIYYTNAFGAYLNPTNRSEISSVAKRFFASPRTNALGAEDQQAILQLLAEKSGLLKLLRQAPAGAHYRYDIDYSLGFNTLLPHLTPIRESGNLLALDATMEGRQGHSQQCLDDFDALLRLSSSLKEDPSLIALLVRFSLRHLIYSSLERTLGSQTLSETQLLALSQARTGFRFRRHGTRHG